MKFFKTLIKDIFSNWELFILIIFFVGLIV